MSLITSVKHLNKEEVQRSMRSGKLCVIHFAASWAPQCEQMNEVLTELSKLKQCEDVKFGIVEAEDMPEMSLKFNISAVPTIIIVRSGNVLDRVDGANAADLSKKVKLQAERHEMNPLPPKSSTIDMNIRLKQLINAAPCMLFMKGEPTQPKCGFSRQVIDLLTQHNALYQTYDILKDEEVRQGLKEYSQWPTYPQLYVKGELVGGLDILKEMAAAGELDALLPKKQNLEDRLKSLTTQAPVMLFMKGSPDTPRCGFSRQMMEILRWAGVDYDSFDILSDEDVRQGLKTFADFPTYPQLWVKGELVGGLDIVKELKESGDLMDALKGT